MKKRKEYRQPRMKFVMLRHAGMLMGSNEKQGQAGVQNYNWHDDIAEE